MKLKSIVANTLLLGISVSVVVVIAEAVSRYVVPISPGPHLLTMDGEPLVQSYMTPNASYRIVTPDFDAETNITADGYRAPSSQGNPDTLFIGDSFTFAQGVKDNEAFPALYCSEKGLDCANLSVPGASTPYTLDRLESYLEDKGWAPNNVYLFFFTGNDFTDNIWADEQRSQGKDYQPLELTPEVEYAKKQALPIHKRIVDATLKHSNLMRVLYYKALPAFRQQGDPSAFQAQMDKSLEITKAEFERLDALSDQYAFNYKIFVLYAAPEIKQERHIALKESLEGISPNGIVSLDALYADNLTESYFPSDGHLTESGNRRLADFLLKGAF
ncbi:SGNH/GDSL hydrolase family protein [Leucothrix sargassi]|nr:SGNH/GDSL hydrolase family protein [Leucothrix sargassi]